jgi:uncharacterized membrane protein
MSARQKGDDRRPLVTAGMVLGMGLGGFVDGILFHQLLQIHSMLSALYPPTTILNIEYSMVWDGVFHAFTWAMTTIGVVMLWRTAESASQPWSDRTLFGASLIGWGLFNFVEGIVDHFVLQIHHVVERQGLSIWDWLFAASGLALIAIGAVLIRSAAGNPHTLRTRRQV